MNTYTKGKEYYFQNGSQYIGYIHVIKGKPYTGIKHVYNVSKRLYELTSKNRLYTQQGVPYKPIIQEHYLNGKKIELANVPSSNQYAKSTYSIYILKHIKTKKIYEVTKKCYQEFNSEPEYARFMVKRKNGDSITDTVFNLNQVKGVKDKLVQAYLKENRGF